ncbi:MAG: YciI-like protein [Rhizobiaceae bacterium]
MLYALICTDKPGQLQVRVDTRPDHVAYLKNLGGNLKFAGPFLDGEGKPNGSLVVIMAEDVAGARAIAAGDPYAKAGLFASVDIRPWTWAINNPETA